MDKPTELGLLDLLEKYSPRDIAEKTGWTDRYVRKLRALADSGEDLPAPAVKELRRHYADDGFSADAEFDRAASESAPDAA